MPDLKLTPKIPTAVKEGADGQQYIVVQNISRRKDGAERRIGEPLKETLITGEPASNLINGRHRS
jgi:hypothetical protein